MARPARAPYRAKEVGLAALFLLPALIIFGVFVLYPFGRNFYLSVFETNPFTGQPTTYVGYRQFRDVLTSPGFWSSVKTTVFFALMTVPAGVFLGLVLAVIAHQKLRGVAIYRFIFSSTIATSVAVAAVIFALLFNPAVGIFAYWFQSPGAPAVYQSDTWALPLIALVTVWQNLGVSFIVMSAGLQVVPDDLLEAAAIDGAGRWRRFRNVLVPLLSPTIFFVVVVGSIGAFQTVAQVDILTGGNYNTNLLAYSILLANRGNNDGKAAVLSIALFFFTMLLTVVQLKVLERRVTYAR